MSFPIITANTFSAYAESLVGWQFKNNAISSIFEFNDFKDAFAFMTRVAMEAESRQHHPDWHNVYNKVTISLQTHDAGGVTEKDIQLALFINQLYHGIWQYRSYWT